MKKVLIISLLSFVLMGSSPYKNKSFSDIIPSNTPPDTTEIGVCHKQGQNNWVYKLIKENSLEGHLNHGDFLYHGRPDVYDWEMDDWCQINAPTN